MASDANPALVLRTDSLFGVSAYRLRSGRWSEAHTFLPDELRLCENLAEHIRKQLPGCVAVDCERPLEMIYGRTHNAQRDLVRPVSPQAYHEALRGRLVPCGLLEMPHDVAGA